MMRWKLVIGALLLVTSHALAQDLASQACISSFPPERPPPDDELMNALYVADPDVDTGRIVFQSTGEDTARGRLYGSSLSYTKWLANRRDARKDMANLWFYLARLVTTNLVELAHHYKVAAKYQLTTPKPRGVIDFNKLYDLFNTVCTEYNNATFWMTCFGKDFYCSFKEVFTHQQVVIKTGSTLKSINDVIGMSAYGIDTSERARVLSDLFHTNIIKFIPEQTRKDVFYQSDLVYDSIDNMLLSRAYFKFWVQEWSGRSIQPVKAKMDTQCTNDASSAVSQEYYCVGKRFMDKMETCSNLNEFDVCLFDPLVQEYFAGGTFDNVGKLGLLPQIIGRMRVILGLFNSLPTETSSRERTTLIQKYSPYITMDNSACSLNWMRRFDCEKNFGCVMDVENELKFDCTGGSTCKLNTIYRFDCMISFLLKPTKRLADSSSNVIRQEEALVWYVYPPMAQFYPPYATTKISTIVLAVQRRVKPLVAAFNAAELKTYMQHLPKLNFVPFFMFKLVCVRDTVEIRYIAFCNLNALFESISMYLDIFTSVAPDMVVLNPSIDYVVLIGSLQLTQVKEYLNTQMSYYFSELTSQLKDNFGALSNYFTSLAEFDKKKTDMDIASIDQDIDTYREQIIKYSKPIKDRFRDLFIAAFASAAADMAAKAGMLALNIAEACNPIKFITGGGSAQDIISSTNDLMQSAVNVAGIARLLYDVIPVLTLGHTISSAFDKNEVQLSSVKELMDGLKDSTKDMTTESNNFLGWYADYAPAIDKLVITDYTNKLEAFSGQLCDRLFEGDTSISALIQIGMASTGVCNLLGPQIIQLGTIYENIYDYQFEMIDAMAAAVRAYLASSKAQSMTAVYESDASVNVDFASRMALNSLIVSTVHIWTIVTEYCNQLTYLGGGVVPESCTKATDAPDDSNIGKVLSLRPTTCFRNNEITDYVNIPTKPMPYTNEADRARDKSYIDLNELYAGNVVEFEVPNLQWLRDNQWVHRMTERAMYIKRFSLFLTPMNGTKTTVFEVTAEHGANMKLAENAALTYILPVKGLQSGYSSLYKENAPNCFSDKLIPNPYNLCQSENITDLCILSDALARTKPVSPTIYNRWKIKATILPEGAKAPQATTDVMLKAALTYCEIDLAPGLRRTRDVNQPTNVLPRQKRLTKPWCNCSPSSYWNLSSHSCAVCPAGSSPRLNGYYCAVNGT